MHHAQHVCSKQRRYKIHNRWYLYFTNICLCTIFFPSMLCSIPNRIHGYHTVSHATISKLTVSLSQLCIMFAIQYPYLIIICFILTEWIQSASRVNTYFRAHFVHGEIWSSHKESEGACCIHLQIGHPANDGSKFLRNFRKFISDYTMPDPIRQY